MNYTGIGLMGIGALALIIGFRGTAEQMWTNFTGIKVAKSTAPLFPTTGPGNQNPVKVQENTQTAMGNQPPGNVVKAVDPIAKAAGVPTALWEVIARQESNFNPNAVGDGGTSWGEFQLHKGGQADAAFKAGFSVNDLYDPAINARFAMPAIASAWKGLGGMFDDSILWWQLFSSGSGHPGGLPGETANANEAKALKSIYDQNIYGSLP